MITIISGDQSSQAVSERIDADVLLFICGKHKLLLIGVSSYALALWKRKRKSVDRPHAI